MATPATPPAGVDRWRDVSIGEPPRTRVRGSVAFQADQRLQLWGRGLSTVDVHLMAAVTLVPGTTLWTRDKRLMSACTDVGVPLFGAV